MSGLSKEVIDKLEELNINIQDEHNLFGVYHALLMIKDMAYNLTVLQKPGNDNYIGYIWGYMENKAIELSFKNEMDPGHYENLTGEDIVELAKKGLEYIEDKGKENTWKKYELDFAIKTGKYKPNEER